MRMCSLSILIFDPLDHHVVSNIEEPSVSRLRSESGSLGKNVDVCSFSFVTLRVSSFYLPSISYIHPFHLILFTENESESLESALEQSVCVTLR